MRTRKLSGWVGLICAAATVTAALPARSEAGLILTTPAVIDELPVPIPTGGFTDADTPAFDVPWTILNTGPETLARPQLDIALWKIGGDLGDQNVADVNGWDFGLVARFPWTPLAPGESASLTFHFRDSADHVNKLIGPGDTELNFEFRLTPVAFGVPEPSTLVMGLAALPAAWFWHRRRRAESA